MVMQMMRSGASGGLVKYFLFGLLGLSVGGLALMDVRGVLKGSNVGGSDIVRVGDETINIRSFDRTVRRSLAQYRIQPEQAYKLGLIDEILSGQINTYMLAQTAKNKGFELDKERIALRVAEIIQPNVRPGQNMQQALEELLQRQGMSEDEFVSILKREVTGEFLMQAVRAGYSFDEDILVGELYKFQNQTRDIEAIFFSDKEIQDIEPATQEQLERLYESVKRVRYKIPEYRTVKMAVFDPDKLEIEVEVTPEEVKQAYQDNQSRFTVGESVILTQSLVDTLDKAKAIHDEVQAGKSLKEAVILVTGSEDKYYEGRDFEVASMIPEMAQALEELDEGAVSPPVQTMLGYHVVKLDERVEATVLPFEKVQKEIGTALLQEKRDEEVYKVSQDFDESLDSGISFEDLTKEETFPLEIVTIGPFDKTGLNEDGNQGLGSVAGEDNKEVRELSYELAEGETSLLQELPSGMLAAFMLKDLALETYEPFGKVKKELADQFVADQRHAQNNDNVGKYLAELGTGGSKFEGIARDNNKGIMRYKAVSLSGEMPAPMKEDSRPAIFQTAVGDYEILDLGDQLALIKISGYSVPEVTEDETVQKSLQAIAKNIDKEMEDDAFLMYLRTLVDSVKPRVNGNLLKQVYDKKSPQQ